MENETPIVFTFFRKDVDVIVQSLKKMGPWEHINPTMVKIQTRLQDLILEEAKEKENSKKSSK